jgi:hypothetical protein
VKFDVIMFFVFFGVASSASAASSFPLFAMVGEINRKKDEQSLIPSFRFSWTKVWRKYRALYPQGVYSRALVVAAIAAFTFGMVSFVYLFGVLPKYALPSR